MITPVSAQPVYYDNTVWKTSSDMSTHYEYRLNDGEMRKRQILIDSNGEIVQKNNVLSPEFILDVKMVWLWQKFSRNWNERLRIYSNYISMRKCYQAYFQNKDIDIRFKRIFDNYAGLLAQLPILQSFVDFSINRKVVVFVLKLENKLFITLDKPLDTLDDNYVLLTISRQHKLLLSNLVNQSNIISTISTYFSTLPKF